MSSIVDEQGKRIYLLIASLVYLYGILGGITLIMLDPMYGCL